MKTSHYLLLFLFLGWGGAQAQDDLKDFVERAHHSLEPAGIHSEDYREKAKAAFMSLNPKRVFLELKRWHNKNEIDPNFGEHAKNLAFLLPISEGLELSTGPLMTWVVFQTDFPQWVDALLLSGGYLISTPFVVEPYCATMVLSYVTFPGFRNFVSSSRRGVARASRNFCEASGLTKIYNQIFPLKDFLTEMLDQGWLVYQVLEDPEHVWARYQTGSGGQVKLRIGFHEGPYLQDIETRGVDASELGDLLGFLNWSARALILQDHPGHKEYQKSYSVREILIKNKRGFCSQLFSLDRP